MGPFAKKALSCLAFPFALLTFAAAQAPATSTTLTVGPSSYVPFNTVVTLTATIRDPGPVAQGIVDFCNADVAICVEGNGLIGTAPIPNTGTGIASMSKVFGYGVHNIKAVFHANVADAGSASATSALTVQASQVYPSAITLASAGLSGNYTLSGTVTAYGGQPIAGTINFLDASNGNASIGTASLSSPATISFAPPIAYSYVGSVPKSIAVGDFNSDGKLDIAADGVYGGVSIYQGNGDGTFQVPTTSSYAPQGPLMITGDFFLAGSPQLLLAGSGIGLVTWSPICKCYAYAYTDPGGSIIALASGDFNNDGRLDALVGVQGTPVLGWLETAPNGAFYPQIDSTSIGEISSIAVGDFNKDGNLDAAVMSSMTSAVMLGNGHGSFSAPVLYPWGGDFIATADFDGDGILDLLLGNALLLGNGDGTFRAPIPLSTGSSSMAKVLVTDLNGDGYPDVVYANTAAGTVTILVNNGAGNFLPAADFPAGSTPTALAAGDFNGDGIQDLAVINSTTGQISVLLGMQSATYSATGISISGNGTHNVLASYVGDASRLASQSPTVPLAATGLAPQAITFAPLQSPVTYGVTSSLALSATGGGSGNPVVFGASGPGHVVGNNSLVVDGVGTIVVAANQAGNSDYSDAPQITQSVVVVAATPTISPLSCSPNPVWYSASSSTCTTTIGGGATGTVSFFWNGNLWATVPVSGGVASATGFAGMPAGTYSITGYYSGDAYNNGGNPAATTLTIKPGRQGSEYSVSWPAPPSITYGTPLSGSQLNAGSTIPGTFAYVPAAGAVLTAGTHTLTASFTPADPANYENGSISTSLTVNKANPIITWATPGSITYGTALGPLQLNASSNVPGSFAYEQPAGTVLSVGTHTLTATFSPVDATDYNPLPVSTTIVVTPQPTGISVNCAPNPITYGPQTSTCTAVGMNPAATGSVAFFYNGINWAKFPVTGGQASATGFANMPVGSYAIVANYSGDSSFTSASNFTTLTISPAVSVIDLSCSPATFTRGSTTTCTAIAPASDGTVAFYSAADFTGKWWNATFPAGGGDLGSAPAATTHDASLNYNVLGESWSNATSAPSGINSSSIYARWTGTFVSPAEGNYTIGVNADDGANVYVNGTLVVGQLTGLQTATTDLTYTQSGQIALTAGATNSIVVEYQQDGGQGGLQLLWTPPGASKPSLLGWTVVPVNSDSRAMITGGDAWSAGTYKVSAVYSGDANYAKGTSALIPVTVMQSVPALTWPTPAAITYGTPLSSTQLDAASGGVDGTFVYTPAAGTILNAGTHALSVTFTPSDLVNYVPQTTSVNLVVTKAPLVVTANPVTRLYGAANPSLSGTISGLVAGDDITATYSTAATAATPVGVYTTSPNAITFGLSDPGNKLPNYTLTQNLGTLTITQVTTVLSWPAPASIVYETPLSGTQLNATSGGVSGTFVYTPAAGTILPVGVHTLSVSFVPSDTVDYSAASATVTISVTKRTPSIVLTSSANPSVYGSPVTFTATTSSLATGTMLFYDGGAVLGPGTISGGVATYTLNSLNAGTHSITASYAGDSNYLSAVSAAVSQVVTKAPTKITAASSLNPSDFGQVITFTFTVTGVAGLPGPTGAVRFTDGGALVASPTLNPLGVATYTTVALSGGTHDLLATYAGDSNYK